MKKMQKKSLKEYIGYKENDIYLCYKKIDDMEKGHFFMLLDRLEYIHNDDIERIISILDSTIYRWWFRNKVSENPLDLDITRESFLKLGMNYYIKDNSQ